ncbi:MAG: ribose-phosphate pyrophosphokinase [Coriobacteriia bacterium]|nr:ribose-phosphate pyrophosphokinase [Coriobacteriia bacterium]
MSNMTKSLAVFSGSTYPEFAEEVARCLGVELGKVQLEKFANGEIYARYLETVRGADVFIVQSVSGPNVNESLMELLIMIDAAKRASARTVHAVVTHYAYARQDRKAAAREPITAKLVANLMTTAGIDSIITMDLHQGQIQGFFDVPVNHLSALWQLAEHIKTKDLDTDNMVVVSPDLGRAKAAKKMSNLIGCDMAILHKERPKHNQAEVTALIGDVSGKDCILNDDMIDTGGSVVAAVKTLKAKGANRVYVTCTHPVFSGSAYERLNDPDIEEVIVTNTIPVDKERAGKVHVISVAPLFARAIQNVFGNTSISEMFDPNFAL